MSQSKFPAAVPPALARAFGFPALAPDETASANVALRAFNRAGVTVTYRIRRSSIIIPSGLTHTVIASKTVPKGWEGFLLAIGHDANAAVFDDINWRITVDRIPQPGFGGQNGIQWGTINTPGEVFALIGNGSTVALEAQQATGAGIALSALLIGYSWPVNNPATPVE